MTEPKSRRIPRPIWFGILAVLMVVLWVVVYVWLPYHRKQVAIGEIERVGGFFHTYWDGPEWMRNGTKWLQEKVDNGWFSYFDRVWFVFLGGKAISDEGLKNTSGLTKLVILSLSNTQVSDEGLKHISGLTNLSELSLDHTRVSDKGLIYLSGLTNLKRLSLYDTRITEAGLKELQKALPKCEISYY